MCTRRSPSWNIRTQTLRPHWTMSQMGSSIIKGHSCFPVLFILLSLGNMQGRQTKVDTSKHLLGRACLIWDLEIRENDMHVIIWEQKQNPGISVTAHNTANRTVLENSRTNYSRMKWWSEPSEVEQKLCPGFNHRLVGSDVEVFCFFTVVKANIWGLERRQVQRGDN